MRRGLVPMVDIPTSVWSESGYEGVISAHRAPLINYYVQKKMCVLQKDSKQKWCWYQLPSSALSESGY